jgi:erythronate-4-phosphate dehydrogenase
MKILVDGNITAARNIFQPHGEVIRMDGRQIRQCHLEAVDALVIRSVTRVNAELLNHTPVRFVGTTTIGTDHLDTTWLDEQGITWASAPGCNADSAAQYTLAMIWLAFERRGLELAGRSAGIIGKGNVGSRVMRLLDVLGVQTVANDPPLCDAGEPGLASLEEALAQDIVCLHVPLVTGGPYPTRHLVHARSLAKMRPEALLVNTARGAVVEGAALKDRLSRGQLVAALDVWPDEPALDAELVDAALVATPHVAGYSDDGKYNGARQIYQAFCRWAGEAPRPLTAMPGGNRTLVIASERNAVSQALEAACFVDRHDQAMRNLARLPPDAIPIEFDRLRRQYPSRRDFHAWRVEGAKPSEEKRLQQLGFSIAGTLTDN